MKDLGLFDINRDVEESLARTYGREGDVMRFPRTEWMASAMIRDFGLIGDLPGWKT